ncbi:hypothetical protein RDABS01_019750 [Bienertia sinuspersici]
MEGNDLNNSLTHDIDNNNNNNDNGGDGEKGAAEGVGITDCRETDEEAIDWEVDETADEEARLELSLAGKIWTNRIINANAFIATMSRVWNPKHGIEISNIAKNLYVFQFHHWKDKEMVVNNQP